MKGELDGRKELWHAMYSSGIHIDTHVPVHTRVHTHMHTQSVTLRVTLTQECTHRDTCVTTGAHTPLLEKDSVGKGATDVPWWLYLEPSLGKNP